MKIMTTTEKTKNLLEYLSSNKLSPEQAIEILKSIKAGRRPREKAIIKEYETRDEEMPTSTKIGG